MKSFYSIVRYYSNSLSKENVVLGLIVLSENQILYRFSDSKVNFVCKQNQEKADLLKLGLSNLKNTLNSLSSSPLYIAENSKILKKELEKLARYNHGILQYDEMVALDMEVDSVFFDKFYEKYIGNFKTKHRNSFKDEEFEHRLHSDFRVPLKQQIDLDFSFTNKVIPSLFFSYNLDGIGANGSIYSMKSININSSHSLDHVRKLISELESLHYRLNEFSKNLVENPQDNKHYLVVDDYNGSDEQYKELHQVLVSQKSELYQVKNSRHLSEISNLIAKKQARKFSEVLQSS